MAEPAEAVGAPNRTVLYVIGAIIALFVIGGLVVGSKEKKTTTPTPPANARAVVVPTDDAARTVVVAPCRAPVADTADDARAGRSTPNTVRVQLPQASGDRAVLIPNCTRQSGGVTTGLPAAAFVLPAGTRSNRLQIPPMRASAQLLVPSQGRARVVVVAPCTSAARQDAVLEPDEPGSEVATAPKC
ncbi:MAG: hypothetical protein QOI64_339 [Solirubrobacteraceae bacterium]|nr:hypothetical protein [Solirubrobacteraceae bacterium]